MRNSPRMAVTVSSVTAFIVKIQAVQLQQQGTGWGVNDGKHTAIITAVSLFHRGFPPLFEHSRWKIIKMTSNLLGFVHTIS